MLILLSGAILVVFGVLSIRFPDLCHALKTYEPKQWRALGAPQGYSFSDLGKTIGVVSWTLARQYQQSSNPQVISEGKKSFPKAQLVRYELLIGTLLVFVGFVAALAGY